MKMMIWRRRARVIQCVEVEALVQNLPPSEVRGLRRIAKQGLDLGKETSCSHGWPLSAMERGFGGLADALGEM